MIFFDVTKSASASHRSGLGRLNERLREELGGRAAAVTWLEATARAGKADWFVTCELFSEAERPGLGEFLRAKRCRTAAIFADAIPLKHPAITWPQSVARHPSYMKMLASFDLVWAISAASRDELIGYWQWLGLTRLPPVHVLPLGADLASTTRVTERTRPATDGPGLLCVGIIEPRKNQTFLLDVSEDLWTAGQRFDLHLVGRVNPHFGRPIVSRIKRMQKKWPGLHFHEAATDEQLKALWSRVRATVYPTVAEGCGLPLLESLWHGVPCVCSDLPVLRENSDGGGCATAVLNDREAWADTVRRILTDDAFWNRLSGEAVTRPLPTWREAADVLGARLK